MANMQELQALSMKVNAAELDTPCKTLYHVLHVGSKDQNNNYKIYFEPYLYGNSQIIPIGENIAKLARYGIKFEGSNILSIIVNEYVDADETPLNVLYDYMKSMQKQLNKLFSGMTTEALDRKPTVIYAGDGEIKCRGNRLYLGKQNVWIYKNNMWNPGAYTVDNGVVYNTRGKIIKG